MKRVLVCLGILVISALPAMVSAQGLSSLGGMFQRTLNLPLPDSLELGLEASILFFGRSSNKNLRLVTNSFGAGGTTLLAADDLDLKRRTYTDVSIFGRYRIFGLEYRRLDGPEWMASKPTVSSPGGAVIQFVNPLGNTFFSANITASYGSDMSSWEINGRLFVMEDVALFFGYRRISLPEAVLISQDVGPGLNVASINVPTNNPMSGWQIGIKGTLAVLEDVLGLGGHAKVGRLTSNVTAGTAIVQSTNPVTFAANATDRNTFEFVEAGLEGTYKLFESVELTLGYQILRLNAVALAASQIPASDPANGIFAFIPQDRVVFEGLKCGVNVFW